MMFRTRAVGWAMGLMVVAVLLPAANAGVITMQEWNSIASDEVAFTVGDKEFLGLGGTYSVIGNGTAINPQFITIDYYEAAPNLVYLDYHTAYLVLDTQQLDIRWEYDVRTVSGAPLIKDISLYLRDYGVLGNGQISFTETLNTSPPVNLMVTHLAPAAWAEFSPVSQIHVTKNLFLDSTGDPTGNGAAVSGFRQDFSQVPEASTFVLFGLGLVGAGLLRRFRKR